jgi:elongation factor 3
MSLNTQPTISVSRTICLDLDPALIAHPLHLERHLEKTPVQYIQWRFQDGYDRELLEKATRVLTAEEQAQLDVDFVGKNGTKRKIEMIMGRSKLKKGFQYEVKWRGFDHRFNTWIPREELLQKGFDKVVAQFDDLEASREGAGQRDTAAHLVRKHLEDIGLDGDIAQYNEISGLSGGQKIKLVIGACLWNNPQICVLDEPSNFLDREALGGLAVAIRDWAGAVVIISHNEEFITALCACLIAAQLH